MTECTWKFTCKNYKVHSCKYLGVAWEYQRYQNIAPWMIWNITCNNTKINEIYLAILTLFCYYKIEGRTLNKGDLFLKEIKNDKLIIEKNLCKGCGICVAFCPKNVLEIKDKKVSIRDLDSCIQCGLCELRCPDYAIYLGGK